LTIRSKAYLKKQIKN